MLPQQYLKYIQFVGYIAVQCKTVSGSPPLKKICILFVVWWWYLMNHSATHVKYCKG